MSKSTRSRISRQLTDQVINSVLSEIHSDESLVDPLDVEKVNKADGLILRAILSFMDENPSLDINNNINDEETMKKITNDIMDTLKWRKKYELNQMTAHDFPTAFFNHKYFMVCEKMFNDDTVILVKDETKHEKVSSQWNKIVERFMVYFTEYVTSQYFNNGKDVIYLMDFTSFGYKHIDPNLCMSFYEIIGKHYPRITVQNNAIDMPWYAKPVMKLVMKILPKSLSQEFKVMSRKELINKLGEDFTPSCLGGNNELEQPLQLPKKFVSIREVGKKNGIPEAEIEKMIQIFGEEE